MLRTLTAESRRDGVVTDRSVGVQALVRQTDRTGPLVEITGFPIGSTTVKRVCDLHTCYGLWVARPAPEDARSQAPGNDRKSTRVHHTPLAVARECKSMARGVTNSTRVPRLVISRYPSPPTAQVTGLFSGSSRFVSVPSDPDSSREP